MYVFLHFHKAAGISVLKFLSNQGLKFHNKNYSANPWNKHKTKPIIFWKFNKQKLEKWTYKLEYKQNVGVIACEWNFIPPNNILTNLKYITCIRDPFKRYLSNFIVERFMKNNVLKAQETLRQGNTNKESLHELLNFNQLNIKRTKRGMNFQMSYNKDNYYTRMLNGLGESPNMQMTQEHLEIAKQVLSKFDIILIIDYPQSFQQLNIIFNNESLPHVNQMKYKKPQIPEHIIEQYKKRNQLDYQLYEYAKQLIA